MTDFTSLIPISLGQFGGTKPISIVGINGDVTIPVSQTTTPVSTGTSSGSAGTTVNATPVSTGTASDADFEQWMNDFLQALGMAAGAPLPNMPGTSSPLDAVNSLTAPPIAAAQNAIIQTVVKLAIDAALISILIVGLYAVLVPEPGKTAITVVKGAAKIGAEGAE